MAQNLTNFDEALKIDYLPVIRKQLNDSTYLLVKLQRNERDVSGKRWQLTAHYQRNTGVGAGSETGLPTAGEQKYKNPYGNVRYNRGRISISGPVMKASRSDTGSVVQALDSETEGVTRDLKKELNYQVYNDGTATRAVVNGDPGTGTTLTVDGPDTRYLFDGQKIDILNPSGGAVRTGSSAITITTVDTTTACTMSAALNAAVADNDLVIRTGATDGAGTSYEITGLKGLIDDGTYVATLHNIIRANFPWWKCSTYTNDDNSGTLRNLTLTLIQNGMSAVEKSGGKVDLIVSDIDARDAYVALCVADKRYVNTLKLDGGFTALEYSGGGKTAAWLADPDCQPNTLFFVDLDRLQIMQMSDWDWMDADGAVLSRVSNSDAYEAVLFWYSELVTDRPKGHAFLRDIQ